MPAFVHPFDRDGGDDPVDVEDAEGGGDAVGWEGGDAGPVGGAVGAVVGVVDPVDVDASVGGCGEPLVGGQGQVGPAFQAEHVGVVLGADEFVGVVADQFGAVVVDGGAEGAR